jgi:putative FmdB family regulatory protein
MPIFEYQCTECGKTFEHFTQRSNDVTNPSCPACGTQKTERVLSSFSGRVGEGGGCGSSASGFG